MEEPIQENIGVLQNGKSIYPYWGKPFTNITGLDPIGQQNASEVIYNQLMPGVTNLTNRIRYFGFYCWLLLEYQRIHGDKQNQKSHRVFIRRAELIISLIMNKMNPSGITEIPGSNTANKLLDKYTDVIPVKEYADDNSMDGAYWKYATGALGQYYISSIRQMGLLKEMTKDNDTVYMVTEKEVAHTGEDLAEAFNQNLNQSAKQIFLDSIDLGELKTHHLSDLYESFNMTKIPTESEEWNLYWELLSGLDYPKDKDINHRYRFETIRLINDKVNHHIIGIQNELFLNELFEEGLTRNPESFDTKFGWYQYRLNEFWQYACGTIFWSILDLLSAEKNGIFNKNELIHEFVSRCITSLGLKDSDSISSNLLPIKVSDLQELSEGIKKHVKSGECILAGSNAIKMLLMIMSIDSKTRIKCKDILEEAGLEREGSFLGTMNTLEKEGYFDRDLKDFFIGLINTQVLFRHRLVAFGKLGNGNRSTLKFELEEEKILFEGNFEPAFTNPRVETVMKILSDLNILSQNDDGLYVKGDNFNRVN